MSRALMPLVSVTMACAIEIPGVSTPPTLVNAPNLMTSRRDSGLLIMVSLLVGLGGRPRPVNAPSLMRSRRDGGLLIVVSLRGGAGGRPHGREPDGPVVGGIAD